MALTWFFSMVKVSNLSSHFLINELCSIHFIKTMSRFFPLTQLGGTVGRGGNPATFKAILSHAPETINGKFRVTEQVRSLCHF